MKRVALLIFLLTVPATVGCAQSASEPEKEAATTTPTPLDWATFDEAVAAAKKSDKPILVDIYAPWCGWCRKMQAEVYTDPDLQAYVKEHFEYGRLNIDDNETRHQFEGYEVTSQELGHGLGAEGTPTTVFLQWDGKHVTYITRLPGYADLNTFTKVLRYIATDAYQDQTYEEFIQVSAPATH